MAKKTKRVEPELSFKDVALRSQLARTLGVHTNTLLSAVEAGHVESVTLGCGSRAIVIKSAEAWAESPRKRGPKPAK